MNYWSTVSRNLLAWLLANTWIMIEPGIRSRIELMICPLKALTFLFASRCPEACCTSALKCCPDNDVNFFSSVNHFSFLQYLFYLNYFRHVLFCCKLHSMFVTVTGTHWSTDKRVALTKCRAVYPIQGRRPTPVERVDNSFLWTANWVNSHLLGRRSPLWAVPLPYPVSAGIVLYMLRL